MTHNLNPNASAKPNNRRMVATHEAGNYVERWYQQVGKTWVFYKRIVVRKQMGSK